MLRGVNPITLMIVGFVLMLIGVILPLLMVVKVLESTFFLNFFSYTSSLLGMILGIIGTAFYAAGRRKQ